LDLREQIGRCVEQKPRFAIRADGHAGLRPRDGVPGVAPRLTADRAIAIPLGKAAASRGAEESNFDGGPREKTVALKLANRHSPGLFVDGNALQFFERVNIDNRNIVRRPIGGKQLFSVGAQRNPPWPFANFNFP
jgi:hypothetical protein